MSKINEVEITEDDCKMSIIENIVYQLSKVGYFLRSLIANIITPFLIVTGYRFKKDKRKFNTLIYFFVNTVKANINAELYIMKK